jgi:predicted nuclease of restriction endonuclease-like RecB superfamily
MSVRKGVAHPKYADEAMTRELSEASDWYERMIDTKFSDYDEEEIKSLFSDSKVATLGISVFSRFYSFRARNLDDLLDQSQLAVLSEMGIANCMDLRLRFFEHLSLDHSGFLSSESRDFMMGEFAEEMGLSKDVLEDALWLDEEDNRVLVRLTESRPQDPGGMYNFEVLSTILCSSYSLRIGPIIDGSLTRFVFRNLRLYGLLFNILSSEGGVVFHVEGPLTIYGKSSKFGYRLALLIYRIYQLYSRRKFSCHIEVEFRKSKKKVLLEVESDQMPPLSWPNIGDLRLNLFDSKVEAKLYSTFKAIDLNGWSVEREPRPISYGDSLFIPDFSLQRGEAEVLVEVIGFWLPEYKKRKRAKLREMARGGLEDLLLIVDEKMAGEFRDITKYPIFEYSRRGTSYKIPFARILGYLESKYPDDRPPSKRRSRVEKPEYIEREDGRYKVFW